MQMNGLAGSAIVDGPTFGRNVKIIALLHGLPHGCDGHGDLHVVKWHSVFVAIDMPIQGYGTLDFDAVT